MITQKGVCPNHLVTGLIWTYRVIVPIVQLEYHTDCSIRVSWYLQNVF